MHFLGCLFGLFLGVILVFVTLGLRIWMAIRQLLGGGSSQNRAYQQNGQQQSQHTQNSQTSHASQSAKTEHKKIFADNEGDYVDFEEVNTNNK